MVGNRREGRIINLELVDGGRRFLGHCGPYRTLLLPETEGLGSRNVRDVDGSLMRSRSTGRVEEKADGSGRMICSPRFPEGSTTSSVLPRGRCGNEPSVKASSSENGNP